MGKTVKTDEGLLKELGIAEVAPEAPKQEVKAQAEPVQASAPVVAPVVTPAEAKSTGMTPEQARIAESREVLKHPLAPGMAFYESPEGYIVVAEATQDTVWCRPANGGRGMRINPRRV